MRRVSAVAICTTALFVAPASVDAEHGGDVPHDFASGGGTNGFFQIGLTAQSAADGTDPTGYVSARQRPNGGFPIPFRFGGEVTCLEVDGNRASIKYRFDHADPPEFEGGGIQIFVEDNGAPVDGQSVDETGFFLPETAATFVPNVCAPPDAGPYMPAEDGNIVVHDAD